MKIKKIISTLFVSVLFFSAFSGFVSCAKDDKVTTVSNNTDATTSAALPVVLDLVVNGKTDYKIIYPENCPQELFTSAMNFKNALKNYTGASIDHEGDFLPRDTEPDSNVPEILVGATNRPESDVGELAPDEYVIRAVGKKLVITGYSSQEATAALDYFTDNFIRSNRELKYGMTDGNLSFSESDNYYHTTSYFIKSIKLEGEEIKNFKILVPQDGIIENYIASLFRKYIALNHGIDLTITADSQSAGNRLIIIGNTPRTTASAESGKFKIAMTDAGFEIVADSIFGYIDAYAEIQKTFKTSQTKHEIEKGFTVSKEENIPDNITKEGNLRILSHNVWGYLNINKDNPVANRSDLALEIYKVYLPDIINLQEAGPAFRSSSETLMIWLAQNYTEVVFSANGGSGNPIFVDKNKFQVLDSGYTKARNGDKGTTWAIVKRIYDGKIFGITNSHFAANSNAGNDPVLGNTYRVQDAQTLLEAESIIQRKYDNIPIFSTGDFNSSIGAYPINTLFNGGLVDYADLPKVLPYSAYNGTFPRWEIRYFMIFASSETGCQSAIDFIMLSGVTSGV